MKEKIHNFFENPNTPLAVGVQLFVFALIFVSAGLVVLEWTQPALMAPYAELTKQVEYGILAIFTVEYLARLLTAPNITKFIFNKFNLIDLIAIVPFYFGIQNSAILRILRLLRLLKMFRYLQILNIFKFKGTILEKIMPLLIALVLVKSGVWVLELQGYWISNQDLGELFAIIGFALGIILAQKVGTTYGKYLEIEAIFFRLQGSLESLVSVLNDTKPGLGNQSVSAWLKAFLKALQLTNPSPSLMAKPNQDFYHALKQAEETPAEMAILHNSLLSEAQFCLSRKDSLTPSAYDNLLQQAVLLYLMMTAVFIPGVTGLISVVAATYMLYGMYHVTKDFDSVIGGDFDLISVNTKGLEDLLKSLRV